MKRWIDRWNAYWFPRDHHALSVHHSDCHGRHTAVLGFQPAGNAPPLLEKNSEFINPQLIISAIAATVPRDVFFTPSTFTVLYWITAIAGLAALVGLFTRVSLFVFALGTWIFVAHLYLVLRQQHHPRPCSRLSSWRWPSHPQEEVFPSMHSFGAELVPSRTGRRRPQKSTRPCGH